MRLVMIALLMALGFFAWDAYANNGRRTAEMTEAVRQATGSNKSASIFSGRHGWSSPFFKLDQ